MRFTRYGSVTARSERRAKRAYRVYRQKVASEQPVPTRPRLVIGTTDHPPTRVSGLNVRYGRFQIGWGVPVVEPDPGISPARVREVLAKRVRYDGIDARRRAPGLHLLRKHLGY